MLAPVLKNGLGDLVVVVRQAQDLRQLFENASSDGLWRVMRGKINDRAHDIDFLLIDRRHAVSFASRCPFYDEVGMRDFFVPDTFRDSINGVVVQKNIYHVIRFDCL